MMFYIPNPYYLLFSSCSASVGNLLTNAYTAWFPVVIAAALAVFGIIAMIYVLSPILGRNDLRAWARMKAFDTVFAIVLILVFMSISTFICSFNPESILQNAHLVSNVANGDQCQAQNTFNGIAICDISTENNAVQDINNAMFGMTLAFSVVPGVIINKTFNNGVGIVLNIGTLAPVAIENFASLAIGASYTLLTLNYVQTFLLAIAPLIFALFMSIGLIARVFGVTRSFGGAMIAFGLGIGIIYPLLVSITYGFVDYTIAALMPFFDATFYHTGFFFSVVILFLEYMWQNIGLAALVGGVPWLTQFILFVGTVFVGLTFIAFLNLVILDAFIVDFSQAIGERMDFISLLGALL